VEMVDTLKQSGPTFLIPRVTQEINREAVGHTNKSWRSGKLVQHCHKRCPVCVKHDAKMHHGQNRGKPKNLN